MIDLTAYSDVEVNALLLQVHNEVALRNSKGVASKRLEVVVSLAQEAGVTPAEITDAVTRTRPTPVAQNAPLNTPTRK